MKKLLVAVALLTAPLGVSNAQANLSFSGGNGTPLTMTLLGPVNYTVTSAFDREFFVFKSVGDVLRVITPVTSTSFFTVNGGAPRGFTTASSGIVTGSVVPADVYVFGIEGAPFNVGDLVTLLPGVFTTTENVSAAKPSDGSYTTYIVDRDAERVSTDGGPVTTVPEPSTYALMASGLALLGMATVRRKRVV